MINASQVHRLRRTPPRLHRDAQTPRPRPGGSHLHYQAMLYVQRQPLMPHTDAN
jgi:hypothetical protein